MRVVLTNDDGVHAPGLLVLAQHLVDQGHDVLVIAPIGDASGSSSATGAWLGATSRVVPYERVELDLPGDVPAYGLAGLPALCVAISCAGGFGPPPDCIVSGINRGRNVGGSVLHSGTLGAALTAANLGLPALAVSIAARRDEPHYATAAKIAMPLVALAAALPRGEALNLNVADRPLGDIKGLVHASIGNHPIIYDATRDDEAIHLVRGLRHATQLTDGTDEQLTSDGYATLTLITPPVESGNLDAKDMMHSCIEEINAAMDFAATKDEEH